MFIRAFLLITSLTLVGCSSGSTTDEDEPGISAASPILTAQELSDVIGQEVSKAAAFKTELHSIVKSNYFGSSIRPMVTIHTVQGDNAESVFESQMAFPNRVEVEGIGEKAFWLTTLSYLVVYEKNVFVMVWAHEAPQDQQQAEATKIAAAVLAKVKK